MENLQQIHQQSALVDVLNESIPVNGVLQPQDEIVSVVENQKWNISDSLQDFKNQVNLNIDRISEPI